MKHAFPFWASLLAGFALGTMPTTAQAQQTYVPVAVTGYTDDIIANGVGPVTSSTTNSFDRGIAIVRWCLADSSFINPAGQRPTRALPTGGLLRSITTPGLTFQLAASNQLNSLRIDGSGAATFTLATPQATTDIKVLAAEGNGSNGTDKSFIIAFADGSNQVISGVRVPDWFGGIITPAIHVRSRVNRGTSPNYTIENNPTDPTLYEIDLPIAPANYGKLVHSITVAKTLTDPVLNVMAVSFARICTVPPQPVVTQTTPGTLSSSAATGNQWYYNGLPIAGAIGQTYVVRSAAQNGSYTVVVTTGLGCASPPSAAQQVVLTGVAATQALAGLQLAPNPARGSCRLEVPAVAGAAAIQLLVLNALGQPVQAHTLPAAGGRLELNLRGLAAGLYLVRVQAGAAAFTKRLLVD